MRARLFQTAAVAALAALLTLTGCRRGNQNGAAKESGSSSTASSAQPEADLSIPALDGGTATLDQYKGKVVLVNFWATWCQPCRIEIPWLIEFNEKYGPKGLIILGVAMDDEGKKVVQPFVMDQHFQVDGQPKTMDYPILLGNDKISEKFGGIIGLPTSMLYSRDGKKVKTIVGLINHDELDKTLNSLL